MEEFQEAEVMFADKHDYREIPSQASHNHKFAKKKKKKSVPMNIPTSASLCGDSDESQEDFDFEDEEMVPPHVITSRRVAGKMAFSVRTGTGRTLKGRDLSRVRNSILRMTGFLET
ncbi:hypothetical protein VitviT2T_015288 [Vitis vinifera]|uniref:Senescence regulator S40 n=2 Tax=Vitis vinifera TaxID=29760 RepID=A0ABY9CN04_VITVI|nr:protein S40-1 [Vitis vinifera]RVW29577.1 hypothetical protein CK203_105036 [Vitis vinifera]WJZ96621.1 hypothetical protein VitviT2T_015288 [Vitis vinifera]|eukprot:XP_010655596.1 PREDICTED: uncharacterized protein LOC104880497 [Vitis vinifera]